MQRKGNSSRQSDVMGTEQARECLNNFLETYNSLNVPDLENIMEQFKNKSIFIYGAGSYGTAIYHTLVKTQDGPQKTSSSRTTPS